MRRWPGGIAMLAIPVLLLSSCAAAGPGGVGAPAERHSAPGTAVTVRVAFREAALPGARVSWRRTLEAGDSPAAAGTTDGEGKAAFALFPGRYFLVAQWRGDGDHARPAAAGDRFAYFGGNPVYIQAAGPAREIALSLEEFAAPRPGPPAPESSNGVAGFVLADGAPVADAYVTAYLRSDGGFRDMGFAAAAPTSGDGSYLLDLPPGRYYLVARKRASGGVAGPLRKGDLFGYYAANPVTVSPDRLFRADIPVTVLRLRNVPSYSGDSAAAAYVEGRIVGRDGRPRPGVYAALYDNPDLLNRPLFLSDVTGADGRYRLPVPATGTYYLGARNGYGGSPAPGDLYGRFEGTADHSVTIRDGDRLTGVDIVVEEVR
jgi:hypothetical protein